MDIENAFIGWNVKPTVEQISIALGASAAAWSQLVEGLEKGQGLTEQEWRSTSARYGWSLRLKQRKRTILYLSPCKGYFVVSFALGDKAIKAARQAPLPKGVIKVIEEARRYAEGTGVRLTVKGLKELEAIRKLVVIKLAN